METYSFVTFFKKFMSQIAPDKFTLKIEIQAASKQRAYSIDEGAIEW